MLTIIMLNLTISNMYKLYVVFLLVDLFNQL